MNISEANAVNVVLIAMDPNLVTHRQQPSATAVRDAARLLLKGAQKALGAGMQPSVIPDDWRHPDDA